MAKTKRNKKNVKRRCYRVNSESGKLQNQVYIDILELIDTRNSFYSSYK